MQQPKRRSKRGVILLAVVVALFVMAILPAAAFAASASVTIVNATAPDYFISSKIVTIQYNSATSPVDGLIKFAVISDRYSANNGVTWSNWATSSPVAYIAYVAGSTVTQQYTLVSRAVPQTGDLFQVAVDFYGDAPTYNWRAWTGASLNTVEWNSVPPHSTATFVTDSWPFQFPPAHDTGLPGRGGVNWSNQPLFISFWESNGATMGTTFWSVNADGVDNVMPALYWQNDWPAFNSVPLVSELFGSSAPFSANGIYNVTHWAVALNGVQQPGTPDTNGIGYDTKYPNVVWAGLDADWNTKNIPFSGTITDSGGSGVAGVPDSIVEVSFNDGATWQMNVGTPLNPQGAITITQDTFDMYKFYAKGTIAVIPNTHAMYRVRIYAGDLAGNYQWYTYYPHVDNMAPSTSYTVSPAGAEMFMNWTNKTVTVTLLAADAGGNGAPSGVKTTEYVIGDSGTKSPVVGSTAAATGAVVSTTNPTTVTIDKTAAVGPVYLFYRSTDVAGNLETWKVVWIWFDNKAPVMSTNQKDVWYNSSFSFTLAATDPNSEISPAGIYYQVPAWPNSSLPTTWAPLPGNPGSVYVPVNPAPTSFTDGIFTVNYKASDNAGNTSADATTNIKIDTRPPTTIGTAAYGDAQWINGTVPFVLTATDQAVGAGVKVTYYRVDQATPWSSHATDTTPTTTWTTDVSLGNVQGSVHTVDFFSIDASTYQGWTGSSSQPKYPGNVEAGVVVGGWNTGFWTAVSGYKTRTVKLDVTAPTVTAIDPKNGEWTKPLAIVNFSGTDVGSGYNHTEWSTDGGTNWTSGETASIGGDGEITVTYRGVDNVGLKSANQTIMVKVASTPPTVTAQNATVKAGKNPTITFNVTAVTPTCTVNIQIRTLGGKTISTHSYANVATGSDQSKRFSVTPPLKAGKYNIRVGAVDQAGNVQTKRGSARLTVK